MCNYMHSYKVSLAVIVGFLIVACQSQVNFLPNALQAGLQRFLSHVNENKTSKLMDVETFDVIDSKQKNGRTFSLISDFITNLTNRRICVTPCNLEAYQINNCCEQQILPLPGNLNPCNTCLHQPQYTPPIHAPFFPIRFPQSPHLPHQPQPPPHIPPHSANAAQCCAVCIHYNYNGPPPCLWGSTTTYIKQRTYHQSAI